MVKRPNKKDFEVFKNAIKEAREELSKGKKPTKEELKKVMKNRNYSQQKFHKEMSKWLEEIYAEEGYKLTSKERIGVLEVQSITQAVKEEVREKAIEKLIQDVKNIKKSFYGVYIVLTLLALLGFALALKSR